MERKNEGMSTKSRTAAALARQTASEEPYTPASQRDIDPYPNRPAKPVKYTKDQWGVTLSFSTNRTARRRRSLKGSASRPMLGIVPKFQNGK